MQIAGRGRIVVWEGASLWVLAAQHSDPSTDFHTHHAIQITLSLEGGFFLRTPEQHASGPVSVVAADARHTFAANGVAAFLFVEPESPAGRALAGQVLAGSSLVDLNPAPLATAISALHEGFAEGCPDMQLIAIGREIIGLITAGTASTPSDLRVQAMVGFIRTHLDEPLSLGMAAARANLSPSRARHLFAAETGLPFKAYVLWQRLGRAVECYAAGQSLTQSAHEAGFADSAHLSRTFRKTFGIPASMLELGSGD